MWTSFVLKSSQQVIWCSLPCFFPMVGHLPGVELPCVIVSCVGSSPALTVEAAKFYVVVSLWMWWRFLFLLECVIGWFTLNLFLPLICASTYVSASFPFLSFLLVSFSFLPFLFISYVSWCFYAALSVWGNMDWLRWFFSSYNCYISSCILPTGCFCSPIF